MAATFTLTATAQPTTTPPSVRLAITETGTPVIASVMVQRLDPDGQTRPVRTPDGGLLAISGGTASLVDNEPPYGSAVTYTVAAGNNPTATATVTSTRAWLTHLGAPNKSVPLTVVSLKERQRTADRGVFDILGRANPVIVSGGARSGASGTLIVRTTTAAERAAMDAVLDDSQPLLLNVPAGKSWGINALYVSIGDSTEARLLDYGPEQRRHWTLPYTVVDRPAGNTRAPVTWADVAAKYPTWADIPAGTTWAQLAVALP